MLSPTLPLAHSSMCDHKYGLVITYTRPWYKLFKKRMHIRCWFCDLKVSE